MDNIVQEAQGYADRLVARLNEARAAKPRREVTSLPRDYQGPNQFRALLDRAGLTIEYMPDTPLTTRSKKLCQQGSCTERAEFINNRVWVRDKETPREILIKREHKRIWLCAKHAERYRPKVEPTDTESTSE